MTNNIVLAKRKAEELGLTGTQIKAVLKLFAYANKALNVEFYLKDENGLGIREVKPKLTSPNPLKKPFDFNDIFKGFK